MAVVPLSWRNFIQRRLSSSLVSVNDFKTRHSPSGVSNCTQLA